MGDLFIGTATLALAVVAAGRGWPRHNYIGVCVLAAGFGIAYTIVSEWLNVGVLGAWDYAPSMPRIPWIGIGLAPVVQWSLIPAISFFLLRRSASIL